jgi:hypothetical protein
VVADNGIHAGQLRPSLHPTCRLRDDCRLCVCGFCSFWPCVYRSGSG